MLATLIKCPECRSHEHVGSLFCAHCGSYLLGPKDLSTPQLPFSDTLNLPVPRTALSYDPQATVHAERVTFVVPGSDCQLSLQLNGEIRIGRQDPDDDVQPELDLSAVSGRDYGVSRVHAVIRASSLGVVLVDNGSTNGTRLNDYRLPPDLPYPLHDGDSIHFGRLHVQVYFD